MCVYHNSPAPCSHAPSPSAAVDALFVASSESPADDDDDNDGSWRKVEIGGRSVEELAG